MQNTIKELTVAGLTTLLLLFVIVTVMGHIQTGLQRKK